MSDADIIQPDTIARMAAEIRGKPLQPEYVGPVAALVQALSADMQAFRVMNLGDTEPAITFSATEGGENA
jgi:hypothetical protein